jgi:UDP-glucose 4-epimerase
MRIAVTGGAGFIGSHVVDRLLGAGHEVLIIDDLSSGTRENLVDAARARLLVGDIRDSAILAELKNFAPDILVHLAAQISVRLSMEDPAKDVDINVKGLVALLQGFGTKLPYIVFISTGGAIYGEQEYFPADERHPLRPASVYGLSKYVSELYLDLWARQYGLKFAALRLGNVYGPRQNPHGEAGVVAIFNKLLLKGASVTINGDGKQTRDYIFVGDVVEAVFAACAKQPTGVFNIGRGEETSVNELYQQITHALKIDRKPNYGEAKTGEQLRSVISPRKAQTELQWQPKYTVSEGIARTCAWFQERNT